MVMVPERLRELRDDELASLDLDLDGAALRAPSPVAPDAAAPGVRVTSADASQRTVRLSRARAAAIGGAWLLGLPLITAVEPAPADPDAALPLWATAMGLASIMALGGLAGAVLRRSRTAVSWSGASVGLLAAGVAACPLSAHHVGVGGWWAAQVAITAAIGGVTAAVARHR